MKEKNSESWFHSCDSTDESAEGDKDFYWERFEKPENMVLQEDKGANTF